MASHALSTTRLQSLKARAAVLHDRLARCAPARSRVRTELLEAHADLLDVLPLLDTGPSFESAAAALVDRRLRTVLSGILDAPRTNTPDEIATVALAMAIRAEGVIGGWADNGPELVAAIRLLLSVLGVALPPNFRGFGDEPDFQERDAACWAGPGRLPAWVHAEMRAVCWA